MFCNKTLWRIPFTQSWLSKSAQVNGHCWLLSWSMNRRLLRAPSNQPAFFSMVLSFISLSSVWESSLSLALFLSFLFHATCLLTLCFHSMLWPLPFLLPFLSVSSLVWKEDFMTSGTDPTGVGNEEWLVNLPTCLPFCLFCSISVSLLTQCSCNQIKGF